MKTKKEKTKLSDDELVAIVDKQIHNTAGYLGGELSTRRLDAMNYYLGEPFGNEAKGRSQVVSHDVQDVIEWMLPSLLNTFVATDQALEFIPFGKEDVKGAQQETDYLNHVFYQDNTGFIIFYLWFKDALMQKNGIVKAYFEKNEKQTRETYEGMSDEEFVLLTSEPGVEVSEYSQEGGEVTTPDGMATTQMKHNFVLLRKYNKDCLIVKNIPPERFGVNRDHTSLDLSDAKFVYEFDDYTVSDLIEMGYSRSKIENIGTGSEDHVNQEEYARRLYEDQTDEITEYADESTRRIRVYECYIRVDYDNDGIAELRKITKSSSVILDNEEVDRIPFHVLCPILIPHAFYGLSVADTVMDLQLIKSTIWRQTLDNLYFQNNSRNAVDTSRVNLSDLATVRPGGFVRVSGPTPGAIEPIVVPNLGDMPYKMLEYMDHVREGRTGVSQSSMGLNDDLLKNNKGDETVDRLMTAAEKRVELIARLFAETGVKSLFLHMHELLQKHQDKERVVKLRNEWVPVNPTEWRERTNMRINVGLGSGEKDKMRNALLLNTQLQEKLIAGGGLDIIVSPKNLYNTATDILKFSGVRDVDRYYTDPDNPESQQKIQAQKQAEAESSNVMQQMIQLQAQVESERNEIEAMKAKIKSDIEIMKLQAELAAKDQELKLQVAKLQLEQERELLNDQREYDKHTADIALRMTELETKTNTELNKNYVQNQETIQGSN